MTLRMLAACLLAVSLTGCATGYHSANNPILGFTGGYWDQKGPGKTIKVGFAGNGFIKPEKVGTYLLYRSAEVTQREGGTHFVMYQTLYDAVGDVRSSERSVNSVWGKPTTYAYIWIVPEGERDALSAAEIIERYGPEVRSNNDNKKGNR
jgi:hypothetical protein